MGIGMEKGGGIGKVGQGIAKDGQGDGEGKGELDTGRERKRETVKEREGREG